MAENVEEPDPADLQAGEDEADIAEEDTDRLGDIAAKADIAEQRKRRLNEKRYVTGRISETTRFIGFGILAIFYATVSSDKAFAKLVLADSRLELYLSAAFAAFAIICDYLQYLSGALAVEKALKRKRNHLYNTAWFSYGARRVFYWVKQVSALIASILIIYIIIHALLS